MGGPGAHLIGGGAGGLRGRAHLRGGGAGRLCGRAHLRGGGADSPEMGSGWPALWAGSLGSQVGGPEWGRAGGRSQEGSGTGTVSWEKNK